MGLEDVSKYPNLFAELSRRHWSTKDLEKLAGRNLIRVFKMAEKVKEKGSKGFTKKLMKLFISV